MKNVIIAHRPTLTAQEREERMKRIAEAAARLVVATAQAKREAARV